MATQPKQQPRVERYNPGDTPEHDRPLRLECGGCGRVGSYRVGVIHLSPRYFESRRIKAAAAALAESTDFALAALPSTGAGGVEDDQEASVENLEDYVGFTRYFRCKHCDAGGPWKLTSQAMWQLTALMCGGLVTKRIPGLRIAEMKILGGIRVRYPTESEALIRQRIAESPSDALLWLRLGHVLKNAGRLDLARPAYEQATALDPTLLDAHCCLADIHEARRATRMALQRWKEVLRQAPAARDIPRRERLEAVSMALERALDLAPDPNEILSLMPLGKSEAGGDAPRVAHITELDLSNPADWRRICCVFIGEPLFSPRQLRAREAAAGLDRYAGRTPRSNLDVFRDLRVRGGAELDALSDDPEMLAPPVERNHLSRNDPCPCGSGRKYKRCCGASGAAAHVGEDRLDWRERRH